MQRVILILAIVFTYIVMVWGGMVKSSDSGLACPSWPLCYGNFELPKDTAAKLEMGHRTVSSLAGLFTLLSFLYVWTREKRYSETHLWLSFSFYLQCSAYGHEDDKR